MIDKIQDPSHGRSQFLFLTMLRNNQMGFKDTSKQASGYNTDRKQK